MKRRQKKKRGKKKKKKKNRISLKRMTACQNTPVQPWNERWRNVKKLKI